MIDPLAEKYPGVSPHVYCLDNPVLYVDPNGMYTEVAANKDGTYTVVNSKFNDDKSIYIVSQNKDGKYEEVNYNTLNYMLFSDSFVSVS